MHDPQNQPAKDKVWIHGLYESQFDLLGAMSEELLKAFIDKGYDAELLDGSQDGFPSEGILFFMNAGNTLEGLPPALFTPDSQMRAIQFYVDHPLGLSVGSIDQWDQVNALSNYRLALPCLDDTHLLRYRFPNLIHAFIPHGIPRSALCDLDAMTPEQFNDREFDVVVTSSVRSQEEINEAVSEIKDPGIIQMINSLADLMIRDPKLGYVAACDLTLGSRGIITGKWSTQSYLWSLVIAIVNRHRRIETVKALQGLKVGVFGSDEWAKHCSGTIHYAGQATYAQCADAFSRGRIGLAWGPTQFVDSYSERIMQAMAGGACVVADDRFMVRHDFNGSMAESHTDPTATLFDWSMNKLPETRAKIDELLANPDRALAQARRGRVHVENTCLWEHRVDQMYNLADSCPRPQTQPA
jgi:glycosyl transferase family 1